MASCVFFLSTGRTGTQTLMHLFNLSEHIEAFHEPRPQLMLERKMARVEIAKNPKKYRRIFEQSRGVKLLSSRLRSKIYVETSARLTFFAPVISELMPNAKFIYTHRNPSEVIRSGMRRGWYVNHPADYARIVPANNNENFLEWEEWDPFKKICWYWNTYNKFSLDFIATIPQSRVLVLNSADIFSGNVGKELFHFLDLESPSQEQINHVLNKKYNAQKKSHFASYREWDENMKNTLYEMAGDVMKRLGYAEELENYTKRR